MSIEIKKRTGDKTDCISMKGEYLGGHRTQYRETPFEHGPYHSRDIDGAGFVYALLASIFFGAVMMFLIFWGGAKV